MIHVIRIQIILLVLHSWAVVKGNNTVLLGRAISSQLRKQAHNHVDNPKIRSIT